MKAAGMPAEYIHPKDAGILVSDEPGNARVLPKAYDLLTYLNDIEGILVIPGFFGVTEDGDICTFSRGGSDITGSIVAAGTKADLYENFTDVNGIYSANPHLVHHPQPIRELTYREMRELAYAGFTVFHDEALIPAFRAKIPIVIKNTNNPTHPGTRIINDREFGTEPVQIVTGIASDSGFSAFNIQKFLMNREVGFGRKVLTILEEMNIPFEHMPSGIDDLTILIRSRFLNEEIEEEIVNRLKAELEPDEIRIERNLSIIMLVGEGMNQSVGVTATGTFALSTKHINLALINQGFSEVSVMFGIQADQEHRAVRALYHAFFE
jgi:aspartate kinase